MHWTKSIAACALALMLGLSATSARGQAAQSNSEVGVPGGRSSSPGRDNLKDWWKNAVILEIYPRSFQDSNGDGIGDLNGITQRLDYLKELGVDAIWLTPIYPSPQVDFGYDISDYKAIDPKYGTLEDFDRLVAEAKKRDIRIIMDMVMNHTSDKHQWFEESRSARNNPYRDWYVWKDGKGQTDSSEGEPPNNWQSDFGGSGWEWDPKTRQYYYHKFYPQQPDLNWNNPKVHQAFKDIIAFWLNKGVAGFRFDAITTLFEDPDWRDELPQVDKDGNPVKVPTGEIELQDTRTNNLPEVHDVMREMRAFVDSQFQPTAFPGTRVFIGETYLPNIAELAKQYGTPEHPEFQLPMDTQVGFINKLDVEVFRQRLNDVETKVNGQIPMLVFDNHDNPRLDARYGDDLHNEAIERAMAAILLASRGAALFYYGDEIGMKTTPPERKEDVKDPVGRRQWPLNKGRDGERTPMQWDDSVGAGFTTSPTPWLPIPPTYRTVNAKAAEANPDSLLAWYRGLIQLKRTNPVMAHGSNVMLDTENTKVLSWMRQLPGTSPIVVSVNFTAEPQTVNLTGGSAGLKAGSVKTLMKSPNGRDPASLDRIELPAFGVYIGQVE